MRNSHGLVITSIGSVRAISTAEPLRHVGTRLSCFWDPEESSSIYGGFRFRRFIICEMPEIHQQPGLLPGPCWGAYTYPPDPLNGGEGLHQSSPRIAIPAVALLDL